MRPPRLRSHYGHAVEGDAFWPRPDITDPLLASLRRGQSHTLFGLRRTGKSSILQAARSGLAASGTLVSEANLEGGSGLEDIFGAILRRLPAEDYRTALLQRVEAAKGIAAPVLGTLKRWLGAAGVDTPMASRQDMLDYWPVLSEALAQAIRANPRPVALILDELPFLIENTLEHGRDGSGLAAARNILLTLREWRRIPHLSMLVAGSIGIRGLALRHGLDPNCFSDMLPVDLPPLPPEEARAMLTALVAGTAPPVAGWTDATTEALLAGVPDLYPGFIQLGFQCLVDRGALTAEAIPEALHNHYEAQLYDQFFAQFDARLRHDPDALRGHLLAVIDLAVDTKGGAAMDAVNDLLADRGCDRPEEVTGTLREDGFLRFDRRTGRLLPAARMVVAWREASPRPRRR